MITVTNFHEMETKDGRKFIRLELTGGLDLPVPFYRIQALETLTCKYKPHPHKELT